MNRGLRMFVVIFGWFLILGGIAAAITGFALTPLDLYLTVEPEDDVTEDEARQLFYIPGFIAFGVGVAMVSVYYSLVGRKRSKWFYQSDGTPAASEYSTVPGSTLQSMESMGFGATSAF